MVVVKFTSFSISTLSGYQHGNWDLLSVGIAKNLYVLVAESLRGSKTLKFWNSTKHRKLGFEFLFFSFVAGGWWAGWFPALAFDFLKLMIKFMLHAPLISISGTGIPDEYALEIFWNISILWRFSKTSINLRIPFSHSLMFSVLNCLFRACLTGNKYCRSCHHWKQY